MLQKTGLDVLRDKVPELRSPWKTAGVYAAFFLIFFGFVAFFWWFDSLVWYGPLITQALAAWVFQALVWGGLPNFKNTREKYRSKYGKLAYRNFFFRYLLLTYAGWYACAVHPLLVEGPSLLPAWLAMPFGVFLILFQFLLMRPAVSGGFGLAHLYSVYLIFPEEGTRVSSGIYSYLRHPSYAGSLYLALGLALIRNNPSAVLTVLIFAVLILVVIKIEEEELVDRFGDEHRGYIDRTPAILPRIRDFPSLARLLFLGEGPTRRL